MSCCSPWCGAYTPKIVVFVPCVAICTSIILSVCGITATIYGRKCGAMITPTPVPGVLDEENINFCSSIEYVVLSVRCVSDINIR